MNLSVFTANHKVEAEAGQPLFLTERRVMSEPRRSLGLRVLSGRKAPACCPNLGLEGDPGCQQQSPTDQHRCFLWGQRDRVDLAHQAAFCLTAGHRGCPWMMMDRPAGFQTGRARLMAPLSLLKPRSRRAADEVAVTRSVPEAPSSVVSAELPIEPSVDTLDDSFDVATVREVASSVGIREGDQQSLNIDSSGEDLPVEPPVAGSSGAPASEVPAAPEPACPVQLLPAPGRIVAEPSIPAYRTIQGTALPESVKENLLRQMAWLRPSEPIAA